MLGGPRSNGISTRVGSRYNFYFPQAIFIFGILSRPPVHVVGCGQGRRSWCVSQLSPHVGSRARGRWGGISGPYQTRVMRRWCSQWGHGWGCGAAGGRFVWAPFLWFLLPSPGPQARARPRASFSTPTPRFRSILSLPTRGPKGGQPSRRSVSKRLP